MMENRDTVAQSARRAIASGILITIAGPPLGAIFFTLITAAGALLRDGATETTRLILSLFPRVLVPISYLFAGPAAILAGIIVGIAVYRGLWFNWTQWLLLMLALVLVTIFSFEFSFGGAGEPNPEVIMWFTGSTIFAAIVLRALIVWFGWMRRPGKQRQG